MGFSHVVRGYLGTDSQEGNLKKHGFLLPLVTSASAAETLTNFFPFLSQFCRKKTPNCSELFQENDTDFKKLVPHSNAKLWCFIAASFAVLNGLL